jgi:hypothetical protein
LTGLDPPILSIAEAKAYLSNMNAVPPEICRVRKLINVRLDNNAPDAGFPVLGVKARLGGYQSTEENLMA